MGALGYTLHLPDEENRFLKQKHELLAEVNVLLGGRAAEELFVGDISTGAGNDLQRATDIIKDMISVYGMSDVAGLMVLEKTQNAFLGGGMAQKDYSEKTAEKIDESVKKQLDEHYALVKKTLTEYRGAIEEMAKVLLTVEVIEGDKVREIIEEYEKEHGMASRLAHKKVTDREKAAKKEAEAGTGEHKGKEEG